MMGRFFLAAGSIVLAVAVAMGAVAAHGGGSSARPDSAHLLQVAVLYQFVHGLGLVAVGLLARATRSRLLNAAGAFHLAGIVAFCGSVYLLALTGTSLGVLVPIGGTAFILGWLNLAGFAILEA